MLVKQFTHHCFAFFDKHEFIVFHDRILQFFEKTNDSVFLVNSIRFNGNTKVPESLEHRQSKVICSKVIFLIIMFITLIVI